MVFCANKLRTTRRDLSLSRIVSDETPFPPSQAHVSKTQGGVLAQLTSRIKSVAQYDGAAVGALSRLLLLEAHLLCTTIS